MARKPKEGRRILREFVDSRFIEIKQEKKEGIFEEEQEESEGEGFDSSNNFRAVQGVAPVLQAEDRTQEINLEQSLRDVPSNTNNGNNAGEEPKYEADIYKTAKYVPGGGEERTMPVLRQMHERGLIVNPDEISMRATPRKSRMDDWHEVHGARNRDLIAESGRIEDESSLPFEKKYKPKALQQ